MPSIEIIFGEQRLRNIYEELKSLRQMLYDLPCSFDCKNNITNRIRVYTRMEKELNTARFSNYFRKRPRKTLM